MSDSENDTSSGSDTSANSSRASSAQSSKPSSALSNKSSYSSNSKKSTKTTKSATSTNSTNTASAVMSRPASQKSGKITIKLLNINNDKSYYILDPSKDVVMNMYQKKNNS